MNKHFVTIVVCLLGYAGSYAVLVRREYELISVYCDFALFTEPFAIPLDPDYRSDLLNPILTQLYKPLHLVDVKLRPSYWNLEFTPPSPEAVVEVEAF